MFSPASFFDVIRAAGQPKARSRRAVPAAGPHRPARIAFYGFRGGAGRTLALAHTAVLLARRGAKLVLLDFDLEAPGLEAVLSLQTPADRVGLAFLLREAFASPPDARLDIRKHLQRPSISHSPGQIWAIPAGKLSESYLATIEELGVPLWHAAAVNPVERIMGELTTTLDGLDLLLMDCRTGFSSLSASVLFHTADVVVAFTPVSDQALPGLDVLFQGLSAARSLRAGRPELLLVPSMVAIGEASADRLATFTEQVQRLHDRIVGPENPQPDDAEPDSLDDTEQRPWMHAGLRYDSNLAVTGKVDPLLESSVWGIYYSLAEAVGTLGGFEGIQTKPDSLNRKKALTELETAIGDAFAETTDIKKLVNAFVPPADYAAAVDRNTTFVVGAKGAGKTWLWRYLLTGSAPHTGDMRFVVGHAPDTAPEKDRVVLSPDGFRELEQNAKLVEKGTHRAFWRLYALARLSVTDGVLVGEVVRSIPQRPVRKLFDTLFEAEDGHAQVRALARLLSLPDIATTAEQLLFALDGEILKRGAPPLTLLYDGLDTGFGTGSDWESRRARFTDALVEVASSSVRPSRRVFLKLFLREDMWATIAVQNQSHLAASTVELSWRPSDLWRMTLNLATTSPTYAGLVRTLQPSVRPSWDVSEDVLVELLVPLWGATIERGKLAKTINYVQKRTSDAAGRLFPRTLSQVLYVAVREEKKRPEALPDRVLRFTSIREGIREASKQRVRDLMQEYVNLKVYLELLRGTLPTGTRKQFIDRLSKKWRDQHRSKSARKGAQRGAYHAGPGGWGKVIDQLQLIGVLGPYGRNAKEEDRLGIALLYRYGLDVPGSGLQ